VTAIIDAMKSVGVVTSLLQLVSNTRAWAGICWHNHAWSVDSPVLAETAANYVVEPDTPPATLVRDISGSDPAFESP